MNDESFGQLPGIGALTIQDVAEFFTRTCLAKQVTTKRSTNFEHFGRERVMLMGDRNHLS